MIHFIPYVMDLLMILNNLTTKFQFLIFRLRSELRKNTQYAVLRNNNNKKKK